MYYDEQHSLTMGAPEPDYEVEPDAITADDLLDPTAWVAYFPDLHSVDSVGRFQLRMKRTRMRQLRDELVSKREEELAIERQIDELRGL